MKKISKIIKIEEPFEDRWNSEFNIENCIAGAKRSVWFYGKKGLNWDSDIWDLSDFFLKPNNKKTKISFTDFDGNPFSKLNNLANYIFVRRLLHNNIVQQV